MKVFLSWSGPLSKRVAEELHRWLPNVIQALKPWLSSEDIAKGAQWSSQITAELEASKAGIICVTPNNQNASWLNFEAGAISNQIKTKKMVCTFLIGMKPTDLDGPLAQFQATEPTETDLRRLVVTLNEGLEKSALSERALNDAFKTWWPQLEAALTAIGSVEFPAVPPRPEREIAEETLSIVRELAKTAVQQAPSYLSSYLSSIGLSELSRSSYPIPDYPIYPKSPWYAAGEALGRRQEIPLPTALEQDESGSDKG